MQKSQDSKAGPFGPRTVSLLALAVAVAALLLALRGGLPSGEPAAGPDEDFGARVRAYLLENPEIVLESVAVLRQREESAQQERVETAAVAFWDDVKDDAFSPVLGNPEAATTIVEFYDYQCPYCRRAHPDMERMLDEHGERVRYVFKQFPVLDGPGETDGVSHVAARAAVAAGAQGRFREFHRALMTIEGRLNEARIFALAEDSGIDVERLRADMENPEIGEYFSRTLALAGEIGISGTPTYVVNGRILQGAHGYDAILRLVEAEG